MLARKFPKINTESMKNGLDVDGRSETQGENCFHILTPYLLHGAESLLRS